MNLELWVLGGELCERLYYPQRTWEESKAASENRGRPRSSRRPGAEVKETRGIQSTQTN